MRAHKCKTRCTLANQRKRHGMARAHQVMAGLYPRQLVFAGALAALALMTVRACFCVRAAVTSAASHTLSCCPSGSSMLRGPANQPSA